MTNKIYINKCQQCGEITEELKCTYCQTSQYFIKIQRKDSVEGQNNNKQIF